MAIPETPITRQEMYLDAIAKAGGGGGSALPSVTSADNGKVLSVVDGAWAADDNRFVVTLTIENMGSTVAVANKTFAEVNAAVENGKAVFANIDFPNNSGESMVHLDYDILNIPLSAIIESPGVGRVSMIFSFTSFLDQSTLTPATFSCFLNADDSAWWKITSLD